MNKIIQTMYLRLDFSSKSLTKRALAQLILKILYSLGSPSLTEQITNELSVVLGTKINNQKISDALALLITEGKILESKGRYLIEPTKKEKIDDAYNEFIKRQNRIIETYFNHASSPKDAILNWFENVTIKFFSEYSSEWISDLCQTTQGILKTRQQGISRILDELTNNNVKINAEDNEYLKKQYLKFIQRSSDPDVSNILWNYGTSCFSSALLTANIAADPVSIDEFKNSKCILDTNILMYLDLEGSEFQESFNAMENIFIDLNISPVYFPITQEEFIMSMRYKKEVIIKSVKSYSKAILAEVNDPFISTALQRGCSTVEDFEIFFEQLFKIPSFFSELLEIKCYDSTDLLNAIAKGQQDDELKEKINLIYKNKRHKDKRKNPLLHDAGLIAGAEFLKKQENCFILSRDIAVNEMAASHPNSSSKLPLAISLDTLINVLAIGNGGTDIDPTNYAPLFANIIKLALIPEQDVFQIEDLSRMLDIQSQIADLPADTIIEIAKELHYNKVLGMSDEEASLQLTRHFQAAKLELISDLDRSKQEISFEKQEKEKHIKRTDKITQVLRNKYTGELRDKYDHDLLVGRILWFLVFPLLTTIITVTLIIIAKNQLNNFFWIGIILSVITNIISWILTNLIWINKKIRSKYSERINGINEEVENRIRRDLDNS